MREKFGNELVRFDVTLVRRWADIEQTEKNVSDTIEMTEKPHHGDDVKLYFGKDAYALLNRNYAKTFKYDINTGSNSNKYGIYNQTDLVKFNLIPFKTQIYSLLDSLIKFPEFSKIYGFVIKKIDKIEKIKKKK